jgi:tetratricopeptide (TPR) repeat protein
VVLAGAVLCYFAVILALSPVVHDRSAQAALTLTPFDAQALAGTASTLLQADQSPEGLAEGRGYAREALLREPINPAALRALGLAASIEGEEDAARAHFRLAARLTRRDLPTHLWWIEHEAAEGDISGALAHYDAALKTSRRAQQMLLPVLARASAEPLVAQKLIPWLEPRPAYFRLFFIQATDMASDITGTAAIGRQLLDPGHAPDQDLINRIIRRYGRDGEYGEAWEMFAWARGGAAPGSVTDASFDDPVPFALFNWELTQSGPLTAEVASRGESDALYLVAQVSRGSVARQLLRLEPGRYQLTASVGDVPEAVIDRPTIGITCADDGRQLLEPVVFPATAEAQASLRTAFSVGTGCRHQWLELTASASTQDEIRSWIDDLSIRRVN